MSNSFNVYLISRDLDTIYADFYTTVLPRIGDVVSMKSDAAHKAALERFSLVNALSSYRDNDGYYRVVGDALMLVGVVPSDNLQNSLSYVEVVVERVVRSGTGWARHPDDVAAKQAAVKEVMTFAKEHALFQDDEELYSKKVVAQCEGDKHFNQP